MTDIDKIKDAFLEYYLQLLGSSENTTQVHVLTVKRGVILNENQWPHLLRRVTKEEIQSVMFSIPNDKSPGPYGYTSLFFKKCWADIGG